MNELPIRSFLFAMSRAGDRIAQHGRDDQSVKDALGALAEAAGVLTSRDDEMVLTVSDGALYFGTRMLSHTSVEFNGLIADLRRRGIDSITVTRDPHLDDLADLAAVAAGISADLPVGGTVRLNERPLAGADMEPVPISGMRRTYTASLEALRGLGEGGRLEMGKVIGTIEGFVGSSPAASLMMATIRNHDETTYYHSVNVSLLALTIGNGVGLGPDELRHLAAGALLHDLGRVLLDEPALTKEGGLTNEEWAQVRLHPQEGAEAILAASGPGHEVAAAIALEHHIRVDGEGYPSLPGKEPHPFSRIVAVADAYDAITSPRPHRPARSPAEAMRILREGSGTAYDPSLVTSFLQLMGEFPPGSMLRLGTGALVMVTGRHDDDGPANGFIVRDPEGRKLPAPEPVEFNGEQVLGHVLPDEAGIDPIELIEAVER